MLLVGSASLVASAVRALPADEPDPATREPDLGVDSLLMVLGSHSPAVAVQLPALRAVADHVELLTPTDLLADPEAVARRLRSLAPGPLERSLVVVAVDPGATPDPELSRRLVESLSEVVAPVVDRFGAVFLTGGETARTVLDRLGVPELDVVGRLGPGTVVSTRSGGQVVVTRPGSFGGPDALTHVAHALLRPAEPSSPRPTKENP